MLMTLILPSDADRFRSLVALAVIGAVALTGCGGDGCGISVSNPSCSFVAPAIPWF